MRVNPSEFDFEIALAPLGIMLDPISVEAEAVSRNPLLRGFFRRKEAGFGHYFTDQDIAAMGVVETSEVVRRVPGVTITSADEFDIGRQRIRFSRKGYGHTAALQQCVPLLFVDGVQVDSRDIDRYAVPERIAGMEVYTSAVQVPPEFHIGLRRVGGYGDAGRYTGAECGAIVIWTK